MKSSSGTHSMESGKMIKVAKHLCIPTEAKIKVKACIYNIKKRTREDDDYLRMLKM